MLSRRFSPALGLVVLFGSAVLARGADGTVKGKVVWADKELPKLDKIKVDADPKECLRNGDLYRETYVVDPKTKGVRWAVVWLIPEDTKDKTAKLPVKPALAAVPKTPVEVDQPCCMFEPHVLCVREGQKVVYKNSGGVPHNVNIVGGTRNPNLNQTIPPGGKLEVEGWKASPFAVPFSCGVHKWMNGYVRVFDHPYYAVTNAKGEFEIKDAPVGKYRIVAWHEKPGYLLGDKKPDKFGKVIEIKKGGITEVTIDLHPE